MGRLNNYKYCKKKSDQPFQKKHIFFEKPESSTLFKA